MLFKKIKLVLHAKGGKGQHENNNINLNIIHCRRTYHDGMDPQDIQQVNGSKLMNYKKLFWGYVAFNFICGIIVGGYKAIQQGKVNERLNNHKFNKEMQDIIDHYNKESI
jgi:hypothetical protein